LFNLGYTPSLLGNCPL